MLTNCLYNSIAAQSDEGCRKDLFKTSQKKGVGYLLLITAFHFFPLVCVCRVQRKMPLHVASAMTTLCNRSTLQSPQMTFHPQKTTAQHKINQPQGRKSSVDAHGVSSCLGCSRILRHLISFVTSSQDFRSRTKLLEKIHSNHSSEQGKSRLYTQFMRVKFITMFNHVNPRYTNADFLLVQFNCCSER